MSLKAGREGLAGKYVDKFGNPVGVGTVVKGNPTEVGEKELTSINIGGEVFNIPQGSKVEANPSETGTTDLTKIKVDGTAYNIPSGGKRSFTSVCLYSSSVGYIHCLLPSVSSTSYYDVASLASSLNRYGFKGSSDTQIKARMCPASGVIKYNDVKYIVIGLGTNNAGYLQLILIRLDGTGELEVVSASSYGFSVSSGDRVYFEI